MKRMYAIKDIKVGSYHVPMCLDNHIEATRAFSRIAKNDQSMVNEYPEDFELWYLGSYDQISGQFKNEENPEYIVSGIQIVRANEGAPNGKIAI